MLQCGGGIIWGVSRELWQEASPSWRISLALRRAGWQMGFFLLQDGKYLSSSQCPSLQASKQQSRGRPSSPGCNLTVTKLPIFLCKNRNCIFTMFCSAPQSCRPKECPILVQRRSILKCSSENLKAFIFRGCQTYPWASCLRPPFLRWLTSFFLPWGLYHTWRPESPGQRITI